MPEELKVFSKKFKLEAVRLAQTSGKMWIYPVRLAVSEPECGHALLSLIRWLGRPDEQDYTEKSETEPVLFRNWIKPPVVCF